MRLIDADAFEVMLLPDESEEFALGVQYAMELLDKSPTVDAVEVVRCKDCKHWLKDFAGCTEFVGRCEWANYAVGATGYCVYGERKVKGDGET